ncbi:M15 family metallopeptidase [Pseudoalteromonas sp. MMG010]|uniref:M15 family metallopeptidase n=1 Tax=Pseudoalteromonas sp. MMG010 TaxID=2822685 RepID=UPI001B3A7294|nr:M15 family metallopeptidase [Pseudoalteromonas sp. MMG010]MBQ4832569.1 M15 family metallopeptidase [Pseudoalteromonas sp. MMG010]
MSDLLSANLQCITGQTDTHLVDVQQHRLHYAIIDDFLSLQTAAKQAGFRLTIASSFRDFNRQQIIWDNKFSGLRPVLDINQRVIDITRLSDFEKCNAIMRYSALPGASRHHLGTDLDVFDSSAVSNDYQLQLTPDEYQHGGPFAPLSDWLDKNLTKYGFYRPYKLDLGGVAPELWHISHIKQSQLMLKSLTQTDLLRCIEQSHVLGKHEIIANLTQIYSRYVTNVSPP